MDLVNFPMLLLIIQRESTDGTASGVPGLPMQQYAAASCARDVQQGSVRMHLDAKIVSYPVGSLAVVHLAGVVAGIGGLQVGDNELAGVQDLLLVVGTALDQLVAL